MADDRERMATERATGVADLDRREQVRLGHKPSRRELGCGCSDFRTLAVIQIFLGT